MRVAGSQLGLTYSALFCFLTQMFGCGSVAQVILSRGTHGGFLTINLAFGFAVTLGILVAGQVSGKVLPHPQSFPHSTAFPQVVPLGNQVEGAFPRAGHSCILSSELLEEKSEEGS